MRTFLLVAIIAGAAGYCCAQDKVPSEIKLSRARYDAEVKVATQPIRQRYLAELNRMRSDAMGRKNLELANAIDAEISAISESGKGDGGLAGELANTTWSWGVTIDTATSTLHFLKDGTCTVNGMPVGKWQVLNSNTVRIEDAGLLKFSKDMKTYEGTSSKGAPRAGKRM
jgi:hypothetical protein